MTSSEWTKVGPRPAEPARSHPGNAERLPRPSASASAQTPPARSAVAAGALWTLALCLSATVAACEKTADHAPRVSTIVPPRAFTDQPVILHVRASDLRPALRLSIESNSLTADLRSVQMTLLPDTPDVNGDQPVPLEIVDWRGEAQDSFWARTPAALPPGWYALRVTNPRGGSVTISHVFESLGADITPPTIVLKPPWAPNAIVRSGASVIVPFDVDDQDGIVTSVEWTTKDGATGTCPPLVNMPAPSSTSPIVDGALQSLLIRQEWPHRVSCEAPIVFPSVDRGAASLEFWFRVQARDAAGQQATLELPLRVARPPVIVSFAMKVGSLAGNEMFVVRGRDFPPGSQALLDNVPLGGPVLGGQLGPGDPGDELGNQKITGLTPPRPLAGPVLVQVRAETGVATSEFYFNYVAPPEVVEVQPTVGARAGGRRITITGRDFASTSVAYIGATADTRVALTRLQSNGRDTISGCLPAGDGTVSIWVYDPVTGEGTLTNAFTYVDGDATLADPLDPSCR